MKIKKQDKTKQQVHKIRFQSILGVIVIIVLFVGVSMFSLYNFDDDDNYTNTTFRNRHNDYNDGWTVLIDDSREMLDLPTMAKSGQDGYIVLKKVLPDPIPKYSAIAVRNYHMNMDVLLNGEVIYTYPGDEHLGWVKLISDEWSVINLKSDSSRGILEIKLKNESLLPFSGYIGDIYFGDDNSIIQHLRDKGTWAFLSGIIVSIIGAILIAISWIYRKPTNQKPNSAMGLAFFCFGLWALNRSKMPFMSTSNILAFYFSLMALMLVPAFVFLYSYYRNTELRNMSLRICQGIIIFDVFLAISSFFIPYDVEFLAMLAYVLTLAGFVLNGILLYRASFGPRAKYRNKVSLMLDRTEFLANMLFPIAGVGEMLISSHELWTEVSGFFRVILVGYSAIYMIFVLWRTYLVVQDRVKVSERLQESQLELMMGQIQPHFIFNTLSSIRTLVRIDPDIAYRMLYDFSNYLRANVDNVTNLEGIKFAAEVNHIKSYVNIEKVRFGERLNVEYDIREEGFIVPPLSIQPLVENAIKHGVVKKVEGGTVWLRSYRDDKYFIVEVEDTGIGFNQESASQVFSIVDDHDEGIGMESNEVAVEALKDIRKNLDLKDEAGNPIVLSAPIKREVDLSGNGSEFHESKGMINIILRLREMTNAEMKIKSQTGVGTKITVYFPASAEEEKPEEDEELDDEELDDEELLDEEIDEELDEGILDEEPNEVKSL